MKIAFIKQRYMPELTWSSHAWDGNVDKLIGNYIIRSKWFSFIAETGADVYVVEDGKYKSHVYQYLEKTHPRGIKALYRAQEAVNMHDVPWAKYDIVISIDPIINKDIIDKYKKVLWCYYAGEHKVHGFSASCKGPRQGYDVFLDHTLSVDGRKRSLPKSLPFPPLHSKKWSEAAFDIRRKSNSVFLDSRQIRDVGNMKAFKSKMEWWLGVPVAHPRPWDFDNSYEEAAKRNIMSVREFLGRLASCRYFLINRGQGAIGQSVPEAASVGCIVLASDETYAKKLCHEATKVRPLDYTSAAQVLSRLEGDEGLRETVLKHQYRKLAENFYRRPMAKLERCLEMKRG